MSQIVYPGSFDPFTNGHLDILKRATQIFDHVMVGVIQNIYKSSFLSLAERAYQINEILKIEKLEGQVSVVTHEGFLVDLLKKEDIKLVLRGIRVISDFEMEMKLALNNKALYPSMETVFLFTNPIYTHISSSSVKEIHELGGDISNFVPPFVSQEILKRDKK